MKTLQKLSMNGVLILVVAGVAAATSADTTTRPASVPPGAPEARDLAAIRCELSSAKARYRVGDSPGIDVRLMNNGLAPVWLVGSLDGSEEGMRYPLVSFTTHGPHGPVAVNLDRACGNTNDLRLKDFVLVESGGSFDPYARIDDGGFWPSRLLASLSFAQAGPYEITFRYATTAPDLKAWQGTPVVQNALLPDEVVSRLASIPKIDITCKIVLEVEAW